ncbi:MAG: SCO family protein [gamma proteobacterium symbiont of Taylorina sp.]|nr:SCO family protein [gamma proteobacterium symbiont of Taylorina sp.]
MFEKNSLRNQVMGVALILIIAFPGLSFSKDKVIAAAQAQNAHIDIKDRGGDFSLIGSTASGEIAWVSLSDFKGKVVAIYFGYTKCPDVCPTNLSFLSSAIAQLTAEEKKNFQSIFISVDPGRDTPEVLAKYVKYFDDQMIGLSAAPDDIDPVVAQYGAYYEKVPFSNSALMYGIDHTSETYIAGKDGKLFAILDHATESKKILATIREAMK